MPKEKFPPLGPASGPTELAIRAMIDGMRVELIRYEKRIDELQETLVRMSEDLEIAKKRTEALEEVNNALRLANIMHKDK